MNMDIYVAILRNSCSSVELTGLVKDSFVKSFIHWQIVNCPDMPSYCTLM